MAAGRLHFNENTMRFEVKWKPESSPSDIDCADSRSYGVAFMAARVDTTLSMLGDVTTPDPCLDILYPDVPKNTRHITQQSPPLVLIQVTIFTCGSFPLAFASNHMLQDGYAAAVMMRNLCSLAKGEGIAIPMDLTVRRQVFQPRVPPSPTPSMHPDIIFTERAGDTSSSLKHLPYGNAIRFSISAVALEILRSRASPTEGKKCSRYQALVALLWKAHARCRIHSGMQPSQELGLRIPINLRGRELPALSGAEYTGTAVEQCIVRATMQELCESSLVSVVQKIMSSIVRGAHIQEHVQSRLDYVESLLQNGCAPRVEHAYLAIPSLVTLPFYDADLGGVFLSIVAVQVGNYGSA